MTTENEMIEEVYSWFQKETEQSQNNFRNSTKAQLISYHGTLGRAIRNHFNLWESDWKPEYETDGNLKYDDSPNHPHAVSMRIIEAVWKGVQNDTSTS
jgi:hypothetical protein